LQQFAGEESDEVGSEPEAFR